MSAQITLDWKKDSTFETQMDGHTVTIDTSKEDGGTGRRPLRYGPAAGCPAGVWPETQWPCRGFCGTPCTDAVDPGYRRSYAFPPKKKRPPPL